MIDTATTDVKNVRRRKLIFKNDDEVLAAIYILLGIIALHYMVRTIMCFVG